MSNLGKLPALPTILEAGNKEHLEIVVAYARHDARKLVRDDAGLRAAVSPRLC
jgi:hypothetical protein